MKLMPLNSLDIYIHKDIDANNYKTQKKKNTNKLLATDTHNFATL